MAKYTVALRGGFSDRYKIKPENTTIQTVSLDERTRVALCNATSIAVSNGILYNDGIYDWATQKFVKHVYSDVYGQVVDWNKTYDSKPVLLALLDTIKTDDYDAVLTVIEYVVSEIDSYTSSNGFLYEGHRHKPANFYNQVFEREYVGYRFVGGKITPITTPEEVAAIEETLATKLDTVREHIEKSLRFLSDREAPDYENSIKESISAVERMCSIIIGRHATLGDALKKLEDAGVVIHPALKSAFNTLYGYTSDASGIRHAGQLGGTDSTFDEAKFMLVSCCAFVNYLSGVIAD